MRYWWVNQNQTYRHELGGGYLWSPKRNANGVRNPFYESMREVAPGDLVFSFVDTRIGAIGIAESYCYESPKPEEFGGAGMNWEAIGWRLRVRFKNLGNRVRPKDHIELLQPLLPDRYSPLQPNGNGLQSVYLTPIRQPPQAGQTKSVLRLGRSSWGKPRYQYDFPALRGPTRVLLSSNAYGQRSRSSDLVRELAYPRQRFARRASRSFQTARTGDKDGGRAAYRASGAGAGLQHRWSAGTARLL